MAQRAIKSETDLKQWFAFLRNQPLPITVSCIKGVNRSKLQNSLLHAWVSVISQETGAEKGDAKGQAKLEFGLPIMERDCPDWVERWEPLYGPILNNAETHIQKIRLFEAIPLTSKMTTKQLAEMMTEMQAYYGKLGIYLPHPDDRGREDMRR